MSPHEYSEPINCEAACHEVEQIIAKIRATGIGSGSNLERLTAICESLAAHQEQLAECRRLLNEIYSQAGNGAPPRRRHALTPKVRDDMRDFLFPKGGPRG